MLKTVTNIVNVSQITGVLPVVNGGTGVTTSTGTGSTVLSAAPTLSGNVTLSTGNLIVASGQGIDFSATPGTGTSELLADYEEGDWTPGISGWTGTYVNQIGKYRKIGNTVFLQANITTTGGSGLFTVVNPNLTGLPYAMLNLGADAIYGQWIGNNGVSPGGTFLNGGYFSYGGANSGFLKMTGLGNTNPGNLIFSMLNPAVNVEIIVTSYYAT